VLEAQGASGHYGLAGMRERATVIGGTLTVTSAIGAGTEVQLVIPAAIAYDASEALVVLASAEASTPEARSTVSGDTDAGTAV
jgi:signal transduction histidine kinase